MGPFRYRFYKLIYSWLKLFYQNDALLMIGVSAFLFMGLFLNFLFNNYFSNLFLIFTGLFSLIMIGGMLSLNHIYKIIWSALLNQMVRFEFSGLYHLDRDTLLKEWILKYEFDLILTRSNLMNFIYLYYKPEYLRANSDFFIKLLSEDKLSAKNRANLVDKYFSIFTDYNLNYEPHREQVFFDVLCLNKTFDFANGVEKYFGLFKSFKIRQKMDEIGLNHRFMKSILGNDYYKYNAPHSFLFVPGLNFNEWYCSNFGKKPLLKKIIMERIIDSSKMNVKWTYFKFLQIQSVFNFNYDILLNELNSSLDKSEPSPFECLQLCLNHEEILLYPKSIKYLKKYYGDRRLIRLLKKIREQADLIKVLQVIENCLINNHSPVLIKKCREWKQLLESAQEEQKKAHQSDYSLEQFQIYNWESKNILNYTIWVPRRNFKLIRGGTEMHNCVGNGEYGRNILNKNSFIFFLKNGKKTQVCIELNACDLSIRSIKGLNNNEPPAGVKEAVAEFIDLNKFN